MTPEQLKQIRERADAATPGPWSESFDDITSDHKANGECHVVINGMVDGEDIYNWGGEEGQYYTFDTPETKEFVRHSRKDVPALLDEVERLQATKRELVEVLRKAKDLAELGQLYGEGVAMQIPKEQERWKPKIDRLLRKVDATIAKHGEING